MHRTGAILSSMYRTGQTPRMSMCSHTHTYKVWPTHSQETRDSFRHIYEDTEAHIHISIILYIVYRLTFTRCTKVSTEALTQAFHPILIPTRSISPSILPLWSTWSCPPPCWPLPLRARTPHCRRGYSHVLTRSHINTPAGTSVWGGVRVRGEMVLQKRRMPSEALRKRRETMCLAYFRILHTTKRVGVAWGRGS